MLYIFEEVPIPKLISSLLIIVFICCFLYLLHGLFLWWKSDFKELADPNRNNLSNYAKFILHLWNHKLDINMGLTHSFNYYKKKGYFCINLIFTKWVFLFHPNYIQQLLNDSRNIDHALVGVLKKEIADDSILFKCGEEWRERKQLLAPVFYKSNLHKFIPIIKSHSKKFLNELLSFDENEWISIVPNSNFFVFDVVLHTMFNGSGIEDIREYFNEMEHYFKILGASIMENVVNILFWFNKIFFRTNRGQKFKNLMNTSREIIKNLVKDRIERDDDLFHENQFLTVNSVLLSAYKNKDITIENLIDEIVTFLTGGIHVTAVGISMSLYELGRNPTIQNKVQKEIDIVLKDKKDDEINLEDFENLMYLECVIKEILRMYSIIPFTTRKSHKDYFFGNEKFPKNTTFIISIYHLHKNSEIYAQPELFNPDRFLPENYRQLPPCSFIPFSHGVRMCIGYRLSMLLMKISLATILKNANIESFEKDIQFTFQAFQQIPKEPVYIKLKTRKKYS